MTQKTALITGGSNGLGRALVETLLARGFHVVCLDLHQGEGHDNLLYIICDLSRRDDLDRTLPLIKKAGPYDIVINNAGINATGAFENIPSQTMEKLLCVNMQSPIILTHELMVANCITSHVCFISSLSHFTGYPGASAYAASKDGLAIYGKSVRKAYQARGVSMTIAYPGPIRTKMAADHAPKGARADKRMHPKQAAREILNATLLGKKTIIPGFTAKIYAVIGIVFPTSITRIMKRLIFERLDETLR